MTLPTEPGSKLSLTARDAFSLAWSLPAWYSSVSSRASISPVWMSWTTAMAHVALVFFWPSSNACLTYQSTSWSSVSATSEPFTASWEPVSVPGISSPPLPCW